MIDIEILKRVDEELNKVNKLLKRVEYIDKSIEEKDTWKKNIEKLYMNGYLNEKEYKRNIRAIDLEIRELNFKKLDYLLKVSDILHNLNLTLKFLENNSNTNNQNIQKVIEYKNIIETYDKKVKEIEKNIIFEKKYSLIKKFIEEEQKKKYKKEEIKINKRPIKKINNDINFISEIKDYIISLSNKIFYNFSKNILDRYPQLYYIIRENLKNSYIDIDPSSFLSLVLFLLLVLIQISIFLSLYYTNIFAFFSGLIIIAALIGIIYVYINEKKKEVIYNIRSNLPYVVIHMASLAQSGIEIKYIIKIIAETTEYGYLSKEFHKLYQMLEFGLSLTDAIDNLKDQTISNDLREFLDELKLTIISGRKISEFLVVYAQNVMINYQSYLEKLGQIMKTFSDLYVGMVLTIPMILISMGIMLTSILQQAYSIDISTFLAIAVYIILPIINVGSLFVFGRISRL